MGGRGRARWTEMPASGSSPEATSKEDKGPVGSTGSLLRMWRHLSPGRGLHFTSATTRTLHNLNRLYTGRLTVSCCLTKEFYVNFRESRRGPPLPHHSSGGIWIPCLAVPPRIWLLQPVSTAWHCREDFETSCSARPYYSSTVSKGEGKGLCLSVCRHRHHHHHLSPVHLSSLGFEVMDSQALLMVMFCSVTNPLQVDT